MSLARAYTNIALVKYWGKRDVAQMLPYNSSLSLTLDKFYTETSVEFTDQAEDQFIFEGQQQPVSAKMMRVLDDVRQLAGSQQKARVKSHNHVPTSAGLASSASAFAALAVAASHAAGLELSRRELSILARHGSGSASRSLYGGFVLWHAGTDDQSSFSEPLSEQVDFPIAVIAVLVNQQQKSILSGAGMQAAVTSSPYYSAWVKTVEADISRMSAAIADQDIAQIGKLAETNAMRMHATTLSADPPFTYFAPETLQIWELVRQIRTKGLNCYLTLDAGPNPKLICHMQDVSKIVAILNAEIPNLTYTLCQPGPGAKLMAQ